jgi:N-acetylneuraminic acid mutarotase
MSVIGNLLYVFGGQDEDNNKLNDLWTFDLST